MRILAGFDLVFDCVQPTPLVLLLSVHPSREKDLLCSARLDFSPHVRANQFTDNFGNRAKRVVAPAGLLQVSTRFEMYDSGQPDAYAPDAEQHPVEALPPEVLPYLYGSRYCETDLLADFAWANFGHIAPGWARVQAVCDFVHDHIRFDYQAADSTRTAVGGFRDRTDVCRDFAHLAVTLCRCLNIPARYCTGYLGDIGVPAVPDPMDFSAWFEVWLGDRWYTFDARNNIPRIGRVLMARGRDAADVAITTTFGVNQLQTFKVWTDELA